MAGGARSGVHLITGTLQARDENIKLPMRRIEREEIGGGEPSGA